MIIKQFFLNNSLRNFNYLIACEKTKHAVVIDPLAVDSIYQYAQQHQFKITHIINTHEHWDHVGGNEDMVAKTGAKVLTHYNALDRIPCADQGLKAGEKIHIGTEIELTVLDTPGHTLSHICLLLRGSPNALFCGDTLFNAGTGNCYNGGNVHHLYQTFVDQLAKLEDHTLVYPGHDYINNNLKFSLDREPSNQKAKHLFVTTEHQDPNDPIITTLALEKQINPFFRLTNAEIIKHLREKFATLAPQPTTEQVFTALRELRDHW